LAGFEGVDQKGQLCMGGRKVPQGRDAPKEPDLLHDLPPGRELLVHEVLLRDYARRQRER
jgi:hypothetical protein